MLTSVGKGIKANMLRTLFFQVFKQPFERIKDLMVVWVIAFLQQDRSLQASLHKLLQLSHCFSTPAELDDAGLFPMVHKQLVNN